MPLQRAVALPSEILGSSHSSSFSRLAFLKTLTICSNHSCPSSKTVIQASQKVVAGFARDGSIHKAAKSKQPKKEKHSLGVDFEVGSDGSIDGLTSAHNLCSPSVALTSIPEDGVCLTLDSNGHVAHHHHKGSQAKLLCVAVDVDEVLGSFLSSLNTFMAEQHFWTYDLSEYHVYDFMKIWGCSQAEANDRVHAFFESEHFKDGIVPIPGAHNSLLQLADFCHLVIVTSRQHVIRNQTLDWIERHYPGVFSDVYFGNHFALEGEARPKSEICRSIGAEVLIDDNPRYAVECAQHGIEVLLFDYNNTYPWSKTPDGPVHPLITRVQNWQEVELSLLALSDEKR